MSDVSKLQPPITVVEVAKADYLKPGTAAETAMKEHRDQKSDLVYAQKRATVLSMVEQEAALPEEDMWKKPVIAESRRKVAEDAVSAASAYLRAPRALVDPTEYHFVDDCLRDAEMRDLYLREHGGHTYVPRTTTVLAPTPEYLMAEQVRKNPEQEALEQLKISGELAVGENQRTEKLFTEYTSAVEILQKEEKKAWEAGVHPEQKRKNELDEGALAFAERIRTMGNTSPWAGPGGPGGAYPGFVPTPTASAGWVPQTYAGGPLSPRVGAVSPPSYRPVNLSMPAIVSSPSPVSKLDEIEKMIGNMHGSASMMPSMGYHASIPPTGSYQRTHQYSNSVASMPAPIGVHGYHGGYVPSAGVNSITSRIDRDLGEVGYNLKQ